MLACTMLLNGFCVASSKKNNKNIFVNNTNYDNYLKDNTISKSEDDIKREEDFKKIIKLMLEILKYIIIILKYIIIILVIIYIILLMNMMNLKCLFHLNILLHIYLQLEI